jgi:hexosaminidase
MHFFILFCCSFWVGIWQSQSFVLPQKPLIAVAGTSPELRQIAEQFAQQLGRTTGRDTRVFAGNFRVKNGINFVVSKDPKLGKKGYFLEVTTQQITITAEQTAGFQNGLQALLKRMPVEIFNATKAQNVKWEVPCCYLESKSD